jgi:hypothetical protein
MTREIPEIVGDNIVSSRILLMTNYKKEFRGDKIARPYSHFSLTSQFDVITISVFIQVDSWVSGCWATVDTGQSLNQAPTKVNVYRFTRQVHCWWLIYIDDDDCCVCCAMWCGGQCGCRSSQVSGGVCSRACGFSSAVSLLILSISIRISISMVMACTVSLRLTEPITTIKH